MSDLVEISDSEFEKIQTTVYSRFGIDLSKKRTLIRGRLNGTLRRMGYRSFGEYLDAVDGDSTGQRLLEMVDILSTNHTYFFREADHIEYLVKRSLPTIWGNADPSNLANTRIWCAGCATGEEPYSLLIALGDEFGKSNLPSHPLVLATDISTTALETAQRGIYPLSRVKEAGDIVKRGYATSSGHDEVAITEAIKKRVLFKRLNLMNETFPFRNKFDVIFCRNVMIYFDLPTRARLVQAFYRYLQPGGYLFLGHSESMGRNVEGFDYLQPAVYRRDL